MSTVEKKPYIHLSIDDTFEIFKDLAQNAMYYSSIFENPYLHFLEMLHTQYGLVASMYCFTEEGDFSLSNVPDIFCPDFTKSADWLKWPQPEFPIPICFREESAKRLFFCYPRIVAYHRVCPLY